MNLPNILTVSRLFLTVFFVIFALRPEPWAVFLSAGIFAAGAITDFFDGYLARKHNLFTDFGKIMDPIADKVLVLAAFFVYMRLGYFQPWIFYVIAVREILVTASRLVLMKKGKVVAAEKEGKIKTVLQMTVLILMMIMNVALHSTHDPSSWVFQQGTGAYFYLLIQILLSLTVALTVYSGLKYFWNNRQVL